MNDDEELDLVEVPVNPYLPPCDDYYFFERLRSRIISENLRRRFCNHFKIFSKRREYLIFTTPNRPAVRRSVAELLNDRVRFAKARSILLARQAVFDSVVFTPAEFSAAVRKGKRGGSILWIDQGDP